MPKKTKRKSKYEPDSVFFLKIVMYFILGSVWIRLVESGTEETKVLLPVGLVVGLLFAMHDHFQIDRKIEYVVLLGTAIVSLFVPTGFLLDINI